MQNEQIPVQALVLLPPDGSGEKSFNPLNLKIYGLTILERTLRALERADVGRITVLAKNEGEDVKRLIKKTAPWKAAIEVEEIRTVEHLTQTAADGKGLLIVSEPLVLDPDVPRQLMEAAKANPEIPVWLSQTGGPNPEPSKPEILRHPVRNREELRQVKRALRRSLVKPTDGWVSRNFNRPISISISRVLATHTNITPNQFTVFTGLLGILTGVALAQGGYWGFVAGAGLFHLTSVLDGVDGELARLKFKSSPFGQWLDTLVDNSSYVLALAGFLIGLLRDGMSEYEKIAGIGVLVSTGLALGSLFLYLKRFNKGGSLLNIDWSFKEGKTPFDRFMLAMAALGKRDLFALIFFILGMMGQLRLALVYIAVLTSALLGFSIYAHIRAGRA